MSMSDKITIGVFSDLHVDIMHDSLGRLQYFMKCCEERQVNAIVQLGDFCYPDGNRYVVCKEKNTPINVARALSSKPMPEKEKVKSLLNNSAIPHYHVIGNHDLDFCNKEEIVQYLNMPAPYYSLEMGNVHMVVVDANNLKIGDKYYHYDHGNYFDNSESELPYVDDVQLAWLKNDILGTTKPVVVFSHQYLYRDFYGIHNFESVHSILKEKQMRDGNPIFCVNGHNHFDLLVQEDQIGYFNLNSISNTWLGKEYRTERYGAEIDTQYPNIPFTAPYLDPLFCFITIENSQITVEGKKSVFVGKSPYEMNFPLDKLHSRLTPEVSSFTLKW